MSPRHPIHITLRAARWLPELRQRRIYKTTRGVLARYLGLDDFRIVHLSIQQNHFHLIVEAANKAALTKRMRSLVITLAKALHEELGTSGQIFEHRYHERQILTPRQARNALAYVLCNWRRHQQDFANGRMSRLQLDPYASGSMLTGWTIVTPTDPTHPPWPVSPPRTLLLTSAWLRFGRIDPFECPGPLAFGWR